MSEPLTSAPTGVIHDIGYHRYEGRRLGRGYVFGSLYLHGLRAVFGLGRGPKAKIFPWLIVGVTTVVAAVLLAIRAQAGLATAEHHHLRIRDPVGRGNDGLVASFFAVM